MSSSNPMGFPYGPHCARWRRAGLAQLSARRLKRSLARSSRNVAMPSLVRTSADIVVVLHTQQTALQRTHLPALSIKHRELNAVAALKLLSTFAHGSDRKDGAVPSCL